MRAIDADGATSHGPLGAVGAVGGLIDIGACEKLAMQFRVVVEC